MRLRNLSLSREVKLQESYDDGRWHRIRIDVADGEALICFDQEYFIYDVHPSSDNDIANDGEAYLSGIPR